MNSISPKSLSTSPLFICNASGLRLESEVNSRCCHFFVCVGLGVFPFWVCLVGVHLLAIPGYADTCFTIDNWLVKNCDLISFISRTTRKLWFDIIYSIFFFVLYLSLCIPQRETQERGRGVGGVGTPPNVCRGVSRAPPIFNLVGPQSKYTNSGVREHPHTHIHANSMHPFFSQNPQQFDLIMICPSIGPCQYSSREASSCSSWKRRLLCPTFCCHRICFEAQHRCFKGEGLHRGMERRRNVDRPPGFWCGWSASYLTTFDSS